jgi:hypothetical protein
VKVEVSPKDGAWVGQRVTLAVTLYTPDLFAGVPSFEMPPVPGTVVLPPAGSPVIGSDRLDGDTFTTQRHEFAVYAQRPGPVRIPAFPVRFETNAGFGKPTVRRQVTTDAVSFEARVPPGAEGLGTVIAARGLKVADVWEPEPKSPKVGDAFTRTITTTAAGVPGMVFPPLRFDAIDGLAAYPKEPAVTDRTDRGALTGQRTDAVTFVCERPGAVTIPDRTLTWFDLDAKELKTVKLPGRTLDVAPNPGVAGASPSGTVPVESRSRGWWAVPIVGVVSVLGWLLAVRARAWWERARAAVAGAEPTHFARFLRACHSADPHAAYLALLKWLDRVGPTSADEFAAHAGDPELARLLSALGAAAYGRTGGAWDDGARHELVRRVSAARQALRRSMGHASVSSPLPPLNPPG